MVRAHFYVQFFWESAFDNDKFFSVGILRLFEKYPKCLPAEDCFIRPSEVIGFIQPRLGWLFYEGNSRKQRKKMKIDQPSFPAGISFF